MSRKQFAVALTTAILIAGCMQGSKAPSADDTAAINKVRDDWGAAWKAGDGKALAALYDENGVDMTNHMPSSEGRVALEAAFNNQFAQMAPGDITITAQKTEVSGDFAYDRGTYQLTMTPKAGGAPVSDNGRYLVVLKRQADGSWKIVEGMGNSATPLPAQPAPTTTTAQ